MRIKKIFMLFLCIVLAIIFLPYNIRAYTIVINTEDYDGSGETATITIEDLTVYGEYWNQDIPYTGNTVISRTRTDDFGEEFTEISPLSSSFALKIYEDYDDWGIMFSSFFAQGTHNSKDLKLTLSDEGSWIIDGYYDNLASASWQDLIKLNDDYYNDIIVTWDTQPVPEPATMLLLGSGLLGLAGFRRRFRKR